MEVLGDKDNFQLRSIEGYPQAATSAVRRAIRAANAGWKATIVALSFHLGWTLRRLPYPCVLPSQNPVETFAGPGWVGIGLSHQLQLGLLVHPRTCQF